MPPQVMQAISLHPDDAVKGGLFDDLNVRFTEVRFIGNWDYNGKLSADKAVLAIHAKMLDIDANSELENYWSMGRPKNIEPSPDGTFLVSTVEGGGGSLVQDTKGQLFLQSLIQCGFPGDQLKTGRVSVIEGLEAHIIRVADPTQRKGLKKEVQQEQREEQVLIVDNILALPGAKKTPPGAKGAGSRGAKKTTAGVTGTGVAGSAGSPPNTGDAQGGSSGTVDVGTLATETLMTILQTAGNESGVPKKMLSPKAFPVLKGKPPEVSKAVMTMLFDDGFLNSLKDSGMINYADGMITLPG